jgi:hypothetical protein
MSVKKAAKKVTKQQKAQAREVIAQKIDLVLGEYKNGVNEKKYEKRLKQASKLLSKLVIVPLPKEANGKKSNAKTVASVK